MIEEIISNLVIMFVFCYFTFKNTGLSFENALDSITLLDSEL